MILRRVFIPFIGGICFAAIAAYGETPQTIFLPPVNVAATETAQVEIMSSAAAYVGDAFLTTCNAVVTFYGADGSALGAATNFTVAGTREIFSTELPFASTGASGVNTTVSAQITLSPNSVVASLLAPPIPPCAVAFSLRTYDSATAVTHTFATGSGVVTMSPSVFGSLHQGVPVLGHQSPQNIVLPPIGLGASETAEVNLLNTAQTSSDGVAASCQGSVAFYDGGGSIIGTPSSFSIGTGQILSVKLPFASTGATGSSVLLRSEISLAMAPGTISSLTVPPMIAPCELAFSLETYDTTSGIAHASVSGATAQGGFIGVLHPGHRR